MPPAVRLIGAKELAKTLNKLPLRVITASKTKALRKASGIMRKEIRSKVPNVKLRQRWDQKRTIKSSEIKRGIKNKVKGRGINKYAVVKATDSRAYWIEFGTLAHRDAPLASSTEAKMGGDRRRVREILIKKGLGLRKQPFFRQGFNAATGKSMNVFAEVFLREIPKEVDKLVKKGKISGFRAR